MGYGEGSRKYPVTGSSPVECQKEYMGQDSWNLQYGKAHPAKYRKGTAVDMHADEGFRGPKMVPGYAGAYKNSKEKTIGLKSNGNPKSFGSMPRQKGRKMAQEQGVFAGKLLKRRK